MVVNHVKKNPQFHGQIFQVSYRLVMCLLLNARVRKFYIEKCIAQVCENYTSLKHLSSEGSVMYKTQQRFLGQQRAAQKRVSHEVGLSFTVVSFSYLETSFLLWL